ncbi:MAG TPA: hydantoinase/oxoprolinase family protein [Planctomycetota bacterium]
MGRTIGIDTGGTFTDLVAVHGRTLRIAKVPSTPADPAQAILAGLAELGGLAPGDHVVHGTTVALNALLTGRVARVGLVTNAGLADLLEIGRQDRPDIYALHPVKPAPLVARGDRFEVASRRAPGPGGRGFTTVRRASRAELARLARRIARSGVESLAIGLLHSYADARDERAVARALAHLGLPLTLSAELLAEHREYERFSTAVVNAALVPLVRAYLGTLEPRLAPARLSLLQSAGGTLAAERAAREPVRVLFSGPAGGVLGAEAAAREAGCPAFVGLDMGGTSTDVAFHDEGAAGSDVLEPLLVAGHPVGVPALDIHTIGCGGGSLVRVDAGGVLHVGPESAGADPGPVAYGRSDVATVTDAHVLLGHVSTGPFLGGKLELDRGAVERTFARLARRLGSTPAAAAAAVLDVARAAMRRALAVMTMQRGQDPARLVLVAFGGAGGLHAAELAASLGMRGALVPRFPGALSARGMTLARPAVERVETVLAPLATLARAPRRARLAALARAARAELRDGLPRGGAGRAALRVTATLDLRYQGQSFELRVPDGPDPAAAFERLHRRLYGYALEGRALELVCLRVRASAQADVRSARPPRASTLPRAARRELRPAVLDRRRTVPVLAREALPPGCSFAGPALVEEFSGTTLVPPGWRARVTAGAHLLLVPARRGQRG